MAAYRDTEVPPGGQLAGELARVVAAAGGRVVALGGLDAHDVGTLIAAHAGPVESRVAATVAEQLAAIQGRYDDALLLADEAGALGSRLGTGLADAYRLAQRCVMARERGGLDALVNEIEDLCQRLPHFVTILRSFAALAAATTGRSATARLEVGRLSPGAFGAVPRDSLWVATIALLAEAAAISASAHTAELAALLAAHRGTVVVSGLPNCWGSCDRFIGGLPGF